MTDTSLPGWISDPALAGLWDRVQDRVERNGLVTTGRVRVPLTSRDQRHAASALLGRSVTRETVTVDLADLDARVRARSGRGGLVAVLELLTGTPVRDRVAERDTRLARREEPLDLASRLVDHPWTDAWVGDLRRTGVLNRSPDAVSTVREAAAILNHLHKNDLPEVPRSRVELAAQVLGDAHALDEGRLLHRVVLRALAAAAGVPVPPRVEERWALWEAVGVSPDGVSSTCLVLGLRGSGAGSIGIRLSAAADVGDPVHLTRRDLGGLTDLGTRERSVLVCENPRVLEAVAETCAGGVPVVCTAGEPNTVVISVLSALRATGAELRYHGDFDWPGIAIANRLVTRLGVSPWLMSASDYDAHVQADAPELAGPPVEPSWDADLGAAMRLRGRSLHEEAMLTALLQQVRSEAS